MAHPGRLPGRRSGGLSASGQPGLIAECRQAPVDVGNGTGSIGLGEGLARSSQGSSRSFGVAEPFERARKTEPCLADVDHQVLILKQFECLPVAPLHLVLPTRSRGERRPGEEQRGVGIRVLVG